MQYLKDDRITSTTKISPIFSIVLGILAWVLTFTRMIDGTMLLAIVFILSIIGFILGIKGLKNVYKALSIIGILISLACIVYEIIMFILTFILVSAI